MRSNNDVEILCETRIEAPNKEKNESDKVHSSGRLGAVGGPNNKFKLIVFAKPPLGEKKNKLNCLLRVCSNALHMRASFVSRGFERARAVRVILYFWVVKQFYSVSSSDFFPWTS